MQYTKEVKDSKMSDLARVACFAALTCLSIAACIMILVLIPVVQHEDERMVETHAMANDTIRGTRADVVRLVDKRTGEALAEIKAMRELVADQTATALAEVKSARQLIDDRSETALTEIKALRQLTDDRTETALAEVAEIRKLSEKQTDATLKVVDTRLGEITTPFGGVMTDFREQFLNCKGKAGPGCFQSRWLAISGEAMKTMDQFRLTSIEVTGIAKDAHKAADHYTTPPCQNMSGFKLAMCKFYNNGPSQLLTGARIYGDVKQ